MNYQLSSSYKLFDQIAQQEAHQLTLGMVRACMSRELRDMVKFAEQSIILPKDGGPFQGQPFDADKQPYVKLLYHEIKHGLWSEVVVTGPSQSGKTLSAFVIPTIYIAVELRKNVVIGVPDLSMVNDKWRIDFLPVFKESPELSELLPKSGAGSQGGKIVDMVQLTSGVALRFMTRGGSDQSKAGFTASHVVVTEAAGWSKGTETSKESDPLRQLRARQRAISRYDEDGNISTDRQMIIEGTVTDEFDLPWRARSGANVSQIFYQCVHCQEFVRPERDNFVGWQEAKSEMEAARTGSFACPKCGEAYSEDDRTDMVRRRGRLLHAGQSIDREGNVTGERPESSVLFFRWSAFDNLFLKQFDLAADEWKAAQIEEGTQEKEEAEKELCQQVWCIPYALPLVEHAQLNRREVRSRKSQLPNFVVPADCRHLTIGVDVGKWTCWFFILAVRESGELNCIGYGRRETGLDPGLANDETHEKSAIKNCLRGLYDFFEAGFGVETGGIRHFDLCMTDAGYLPDAVYETVRERDRSRYVASLGRGRTQLDARRYEAPRTRSSIVRSIGDRYHVELVIGKGVVRLVFDADDSKLAIQACLRVRVGNPGALSLPAAPDSDHTMIARHLASEVYRRWVEPGKGIQESWQKKGANHLLDCSGMAYVAAKRLGWRIPDTIRPYSAAVDETTPASGINPTESQRADSALVVNQAGKSEGNSPAPHLVQTPHSKTVPAWRRRLEELKTNAS